MMPYLPKILLTGAAGQLGQSLTHHAQAKHFKLIACSRQALDICNHQAIVGRIKKFSPDLIINAAAYTAVDQAEREKQQAMAINYQGVKNLAIACEAHHIPLIHLSTDYVFDGQANKAYREEDALNPINVYGETKCLGEEAIRASCENHIILRVSALFSEYGRNFFLTILKLAREQAILSIVADQITCPTNAKHLASVIYHIAKNPKRTGTFHYCDRPAVSWYDFAKKIVDTYYPERSHTVRAIKTIDYPIAAKRPQYSVLNCDKIFRIYGIKQANWEMAEHAT